MKAFYRAVAILLLVIAFCVGVLILNPHSDPTSREFITHPVIVAIGMLMVAGTAIAIVYSLVVKPIIYFYKKVFKKDEPPKEEYVSKWDE